MNNSIKLLGFNKNNKTVFFKDTKSDNILTRKISLCVDSLFHKGGTKTFFRHNKKKYYIEGMEGITC